MLYCDPASHFPDPLILSLVPPGTETSMQILCPRVSLAGSGGLPPGIYVGTFYTEAPDHPISADSPQPTTLYSKPQGFNFLVSLTAIWFISSQA